MHCKAAALQCLNFTYTLNSSTGSLLLNYACITQPVAYNRFMTISLHLCKSSLVLSINHLMSLLREKNRAEGDTKRFYYSHYMLLLLTFILVPHCIWSVKWPFLRCSQHFVHCSYTI